VKVEQATCGHALLYTQVPTLGSQVAVWQIVDAHGFFVLEQLVVLEHA